MEVFTDFYLVKNYGDRTILLPPSPHPQPPNLLIFTMVGFLRVDGRGFCWQISSDPHYIWLFTQVTVYTSKSNLKVINSWH